MNIQNIRRLIIASLLGYYLDGWQDLIENMGEKAEEVENAVFTQLTERNMPEVTVARAMIREGVLSGDYRDYIITTTSPGARTTISISRHGNDLFASWRSFIRTTFNWKLLKIYAVVALATAVLGAITIYITSICATTRGIIASDYWKLFIRSIGNWLFFAAGLFVCVVVVLVVAGRIIRRNEHAFLPPIVIVISILFSFTVSLFVENVGQDLVQGISFISRSYKVGVPSLIEHIIYIVGTTLGSFCGILIWAVIAGIFLRRHLLAFILKEPSLFDAEDISAMNLSVHKSILRALDSQGIDITKLRLKNEFKGGRRE